MQEPQRLRLRPHRRGDFIAGAILAVAGAAYAIAVYWFFESGLAAWGSAPGVLKTLSALSIALTLLALGWSVIRDLRWLYVEERDVEFVLRHGEDLTRLELVLRSPKNRELILRGQQPDEGDDDRRTETLIDDRVVRMRRLLDAGADQRLLFNEAELRGVALARSAVIGSTARYVSGLLLLLTVLGTFIGVKQALPELVRALESSTQQQAGDVAALMQGALNGVTAAFGANLAALLGAIALGVAAFGLNAGRHNMLARLEQASSQHVFAHLGGVASGDSIGTALQTLAQSSQNLATAVDGIRDMQASMERLSAGVGESLVATRQAVDSLIRSQQEQLGKQNRELIEFVVQKIERQITDTATAVQHATALYGAMLGTLTQRSDVLAETTTLLDGTLREMQQSREIFGRYADEANRSVATHLEQMREPLGRLERAAAAQTEVAEQAAGHYRALTDRVGALVHGVGDLAGGIRDAEAERRAALENLEHKTAAAVAAQLTRPVLRLAQSIEEVPARVGEGIVAIVPQVQSLAQSLADAERRRQATLDELEQRVAGVVVRQLGPVVAQLETDVREMPAQIAAGMRDAITAGAAAQREQNAALVTTLRRLTDAVDELSFQQGRPLLERVLGRGGGERRSVPRERPPTPASGTPVSRPPASGTPASGAPAAAERAAPARPTPARASGPGVPAPAGDGTRIFGGSLSTTDGLAHFTAASRPMVTIRWRPGAADAEVYVNPDFAFADDNGARLSVAFDIDGRAGSGRYETVAPARVAWSEDAGTGRVTARGRARRATT